MVQEKYDMPLVTRAVYIIGGIAIVLAAVKVVYSGCKYLMDFLQSDPIE